jgi:hypothetical protein
LEDAILSFDPESAPRAARRRQVGSLIVGQSMPATVTVHLNQIKECYAFGLFESAVVFCRAVIEAAVFEFARRRGLLRAGPSVRDYAEYSLAQLRERVRSRLGRRAFEAAFGDKGVVTLANHVLHSKRAPVDVNSREALRMVRATFEILEHIFQ